MKCQPAYTKDQINKLGNTIIYLCKNMGTLSKTHILKLIYIIEEASIVRFGIPFFGLNFKLWKLGPVSTELYAELSEELNLLKDYLTVKSGDGGTEITPIKNFSDDEFSDREMLLLHEIAERFKYCTAKELINHTHRKNSLWYNTALENGVLEVLEKGLKNTTEIEMDLSGLLNDDENKKSLYTAHKDFLEQSKLLKS